ncbi:MAG TPA: ABC transporter permease [Chitinophagales bacterium]|nr:ABC transporter permease [Chitinophagales bacterium]
MNLTENIKLALRAIQSNILRTILTLSIIMFGITALIGILTATEGIKTKMLSSFSEMGATTFSVTNEGAVKNTGGSRRRRKSENPPITIQQVNAFKKNYKYPATVAISNMANDIAIIKNESKKTNPNVKVVGIDDNYLKVSGQNIAEGRNFSKTEIESGSDVILLGRDVVAKIFNPYDTVVGRLVSIGSKKFKVTGILASKGASQIATDNQVMIPVQNARWSFPDNSTSYLLNVMVGSAEELDMAIDEATGVLRGVRNLRVNDMNDFDIAKSERLADQILDQMSYIKIATIVIGILTLIGAGIGLMNIMLVSVNERTREIGISKALGANKQTIRIQFLTEAIVICQIGGILGIILGIGIGNLVGVFLKTGFIFPYLWVIGGWVFTFIVGLAAGIYPAIKASEMDPVEALRTE